LPNGFSLSLLGGRYDNPFPGELRRDKLRTPYARAQHKYKGFPAQRARAYATFHEYLFFF
jgi:hypothetical protein